VATQGVEPLLTVEELAAVLQVPVATLYQWRVTGRGPAGVRVGRHVRYRRSEVERWLDEQQEAGRS
jgi:excisionase family DNA binding protein